MISKIKEFYNKNAISYDLHMISTGHYIAQDIILKRLSNQIRAPICD